SRNTITLCNKVCDGEVNIRVCCAECCKVVLYCISAAQSPKRVMELDVGCEDRVRRRHISVVEHLLVVGPCRCLILENCKHFSPCWDNCVQPPPLQARLLGVVPSHTTA